MRLIVTAKKLLYAQIQALNLDITLPRYAKRKGPNRNKSDILDIIRLCHEVGSSVPVFVARDLSSLPTVSANCFDMALLMRDIEAMKLQLLGLADMATVSRQIVAAVETIKNDRPVIDATHQLVDGPCIVPTVDKNDVLLHDNVDSCPSVTTCRAINVDSCPSVTTRRAINVDSCPSVSTCRVSDVDSRPSAKTRRAIDVDSCPSVSTCRVSDVHSRPSVTTCRVSDVHSRSSDQDDDGTPFDTTSAVCTGVIDNGCNPVFVCGSLRVSNWASAGRKNHDVDPKTREQEPSVAVAVNSPAAACGGVISPLESARPARPTKTMAEVVADTREFQPVTRQRSRRVPSNSLATAETRSRKVNNPVHIIGSGERRLSGGIQAAPRRRRESRTGGLFISRLAPNTSASALRRHIKDSCDVTVTCAAIKTKFDSYCSFRVFADANLERLLTPSVWPSGVLVREFV